MLEKLPKTITVFAEHCGGHLQGIAIDKNRQCMYFSFTTCLLKTDLNGDIIGSVKGLIGHLGCIAYNSLDGKVYGSLEFKHDSIGSGILANIGYKETMQDGFYIVCFDTDMIDRLDIDAENSNIMQSVFLHEVYDDYSADGHRLGCSGIDGITFAPAIGKNGDTEYLYIAYGIYGDTAREDNDYQVILKYDISDWKNYTQPLNQRNMHRYGPEKPDAKYFVYTGNTTYGIQNLEYDAFSQSMIAAVYPGQKAQFPNYPMFFIDCTHAPKAELLKGVNKEGLVIPLTDFGSNLCCHPIPGSAFPHGSTGIASLGNGYFYISEPFTRENGHGGVITLYQFNHEKLTFEKV